jgi:hypothetical protein
METKPRYITLTMEQREMLSKAALEDKPVPWIDYSENHETAWVLLDAWNTWLASQNQSEGVK